LLHPVLDDYLISFPVRFKSRHYARLITVRDRPSKRPRSEWPISSSNIKRFIFLRKIAIA
jgi:hypothetical protein